MDIRNKTVEALRGGKIIGDGHTIFSPDFFAPFFTEADLAPITRTYESDGSPKGSIFNSDGEVISEVKGVYNLDFLYWLADRVGVAHDGGLFFGRGSQASAIVEALRKALL